MYPSSISFAGAGKVAEALCRGLFHAGFKIDTIISETKLRGPSLASSCNAEWSSELQFPDSTKVILVAVPDHKLVNVLNAIRCNPTTVVAHTAGSYGLNVFPQNFEHIGIFYPLQTFSVSRKVSFTDLPILIEASDDESSQILRKLAGALSGKIHVATLDQRRLLHLAAVFVNNFTNHLLTEGREIALKSDIPFEILTPLIKETVFKALELGPENSQTGPAMRNDYNTIEKHLELLSFSPELQNMYKVISNSIIEYYKK